MARDLNLNPLSYGKRGFALFQRLRPRLVAGGSEAHLRERGVKRAPHWKPGLAPLLALALLSALLAGCAIHPGGEQIAWQVGDQLWVANPDGSSARQIAPHEVAGYAWSPDHHEL